MENWYPVYDFQVKFHSFFRQIAWFLYPVYKKSSKILEFETLFMSGESKNHTLKGGTSPYSLCIGVPPPRAKHHCFFEWPLLEVPEYLQSFTINYTSIKRPRPPSGVLYGFDWYQTFNSYSLVTPWPQGTRIWNLSQCFNVKRLYIFCKRYRSYAFRFGCSEPNDHH